jgi:hypothetical protein
MDIKNLPGNSKFTKKEEPERKPLQKVISGRVVKKKKGFGEKFAESFLGNDRRSVGEYIIHDVLIPAAKDTIADMVKGSIEMFLFGERRGSRTSRERGKSYVSYSSYYKGDRDRERDDKRSRTNRARHDFDDIILETRGEAEEVLSQLVDLTEDYGMVSVADFYELVGEKANFTDEKWGWTNLRSATVDRVRGGYLIKLPRTEQLD